MKIPKNTKQVMKFVRKVCETVYGILSTGDPIENVESQEELGLWVRVHEALSNLAAFYEENGYKIWKEKA